MQRQRKDGNPLRLPARCHYKHGAFWYVHSVGRWESLGSDIAKACEKAGHYNKHVQANGTVAWCIDAYLLHLEQLVKLGKKAARTLSDYQKYALSLKDYFGKMRLDEVQAHHVKTYLDINDKLGRGVSANREKALLSGAFSWIIGSQQGVIVLNPCAKAGRNKEMARARYVSDEEYHAVQSLATPNVQLAMELMYRTLQSPSDVLRYRRDAIRMCDGKRIFRFRQDKTKRTLDIEIDAHFQVMIEHGAGAGDYLLVSRLSKPYTPNGMASMLHRYQKIAGIASFGLQDLKAKGATDMYQSGVALDIICELLGHKSVSTTEVYVKQHLTSS